MGYFEYIELLTSTVLLIKQHGGLVFRNKTPDTWMTKGHRYIIKFEVKGKSSGASEGYCQYWSNNCGWEGGGLKPAPSDVIVNNPVTANFSSDDWVTFSYAWTINDELYKVCTTAYSSYVVGNIYPSYKDFKFGFDYRQTGSMGTDLYLRNFRMYDITTNRNYNMISKLGVISTINVAEGPIKTSIDKSQELMCNEIIED